MAVSLNTLTSCFHSENSDCNLQLLGTVLACSAVGGMCGLLLEASLITCVIFAVISGCIGLGGYFFITAEAPPDPITEPQNCEEPLPLDDTGMREWMAKWGDYVIVNTRNTLDEPLCFAFSTRIAMKDQDNPDLQDESELGPYTIQPVDRALQSLHHLNINVDERSKVAFSSEYLKLMKHSQANTVGPESSPRVNFYLKARGFDPSQLVFATAMEEDDVIYKRCVFPLSVFDFIAVIREETTLLQLVRKEDGSEFFPQDLVIEEPLSTQLRNLLRAYLMQDFRRQLLLSMDALQKSHGVIVVAMQFTKGNHQIYMRFDEKRRMIRIFDNNIGILRFPLKEEEPFQQGVDKALECFSELCATYPSLRRLFAYQLNKSQQDET